MRVLLGPNVSTIIGELPLHSIGKASTSIALAALPVVLLLEAGCTALAGANDVATLAEASVPIDAASTGTDGGAASDSAMDGGAIDSATALAAESGTSAPCTISGTITEFPLPGDAGNAPAEITTGPDGNLWFTWSFTPAFANGIGIPGAAFGRMTPTGLVNEFELPTPASEPLSIVAGPDGNLWITEFQAGKIARVSLGDGGITEFAIASMGRQPNGIASDPDGTLWFTDRSSNAIGRISTADTHAVEFTIPTPKSQPTGIAMGPDGNLWFVEQEGLNVGRISTDGGIQEFPVPTPAGYEGSIAAGPDGNLWFTEYAHGKIGRLGTDGGIGEFLIPIPDSSPVAVAAGPDGAMWMTDGMTNNIIRVTTAGVFTAYPIPTPNAGATGITPGPDGNVWFTEGAVNKLGRVCLVAGSAYGGGESSACSDAGAVVNPEDGGSECMTEFGGLTLSSNPQEIVQGPDGDLWFTELGANKVGRMTPCGALLREFRDSNRSVGATRYRGWPGRERMVYGAHREQHRAIDDRRRYQRVRAPKRRRWPGRRRRSCSVRHHGRSGRRAVVCRVRHRQNRAHEHDRNTHGISAFDRSVA